MKKIILLSGFLFGTLSMNAQEFNLGLSGVLPIGDIEESSNFGLNVEASYLRNVSEQFDAGVTAGYINFFGKSVDFPGVGTVNFNDLGFLPIAASGRFHATEKLTFGADLGYAIGITPSELDGGFYYAPKVHYGITPTLDVVFAYKGISLDGGTAEALTLGVEIGL